LVVLFSLVISRRCVAHSNHRAHKLCRWSRDLVYRNVIFTFIGQYLSCLTNQKHRHTHKLNYIHVYSYLQLTVADLAVYDMMENILGRHPEAHDKLPGLKANRKKIAETKNIKEYLAKRPTYPM